MNTPGTNAKPGLFAAPLFVRFELTEELKTEYDETGEEVEGTGKAAAKILTFGRENGGDDEPDPEELEKYFKLDDPMIEVRNGVLKFGGVDGDQGLAKYWPDSRRFEVLALPTWHYGILNSHLEFESLAEVDLYYQNGLRVLGLRGEHVEATCGLLKDGWRLTSGSLVRIEINLANGLWNVVDSDPCASRVPEEE